jgi:hypothetical protein
VHLSSLCKWLGEECKCNATGALPTHVRVGGIVVVEHRSPHASVAIRDGSDASHMAATPPIFSALLASETSTSYAGEVEGLMVEDGLVVVAVAAPMDCYRVHQLPTLGVHVASWLWFGFGPFASTPTGGSSGAGSNEQRA